MRKSLVDELRKVSAPRWMIDNAITGEYGDFTSSSPTPIMDLVMDAMSVGLDGIAEMAKNGEFDG